MKVYYAKFYQAVDIKNDKVTYLGGKMPNVKGAEMEFEGGLLTIKTGHFQNVYVPYSNIMFMHSFPEDVKETKAKK